MTLEELPAWVSEQAEIHADRLNELLDSCLIALAIAQRKAGLRAVISQVQAGGFVNVTVTDAELKVASPYAQMQETSRELRKRLLFARLRPTVETDAEARGQHVAGLVGRPRRLDGIASAISLYDHRARMLLVFGTAATFFG